MKKFKFSLESLYKMREMNVENAKIELGRIQQQISDIEFKIQQYSTQIDDLHHSQNSLLESGLSGRELQYFPFFSKAKSNHVSLLQKEHAKLKGLASKALEKLSLLQGEFKVIENLKEKEFVKFKKNYNKFLADKLEEQVLMWSANQANTNQDEV